MEANMVALGWIRGWLALGVALAVGVGTMGVAGSDPVMVTAQPAQTVAPAAAVVAVAPMERVQFQNAGLTCTGGTVNVSGPFGQMYQYILGSFGDDCSLEDDVAPGCAGIPSVGLAVNGLAAPDLVGLADTVIGGSLDAVGLNSAASTTFFFQICGVQFRLENPLFVDTTPREPCPASPQLCTTKPK